MSVLQLQTKSKTCDGPCTPSTALPTAVTETHSYDQNKTANIKLLGIIAATSGLLFGFDTGVISGAQEFLNRTFGLSSHSVSEAALKGFVVAAVPLGALFGSVVSGILAHRLGRRLSLILTAIIFFIGTLLAMLASSISLVIAGRLVIGSAIGISAMITPMYLSEISPPKVRGSIVFMFQLAITIGILAAFAVDLLFAQWITDHTMNWRWMFGVGIIPAVVLFFGMLRLPYSPRWLVLKNRRAEAKPVLQYLLGKEDVLSELDEIHASVAEHKGTRLRDLFNRTLLPLLGMSFGLFVFQQLSGINAIMYYGPVVFEQAGFGETTKLIAQLMMGVVNVVMTIFGVWIIDRAGRRALLNIGFAGMIVSLITVGFILQSTATHGIMPYVIFASLLLFIGFFAISLGGVPYIIMSEVFPLKARAMGMAVASCANWGFNLLVSETFEMLRMQVGIGNLFFIYGGCTIVGFIFAWRFVPETKNQPLEALEANLYAGKPIRHLGG